MGCCGLCVEVPSWWTRRHIGFVDLVSRSCLTCCVCNGHLACKQAGASQRVEDACLFISISCHYHCQQS